jgi:hypothetical protein
MQLALEDAGLAASQIGQVNAHGTSTPLNDAAEAEAIRKVFGESPPPVTSTKGVTGHLIGAAGATEAVACLLAMRNGSVPPTANLERLGDDIQLDVVHGEPRSVAPNPALSNSFGFGGHNVTPSPPAVTSTPIHAHADVAAPRRSGGGQPPGHVVPDRGWLHHGATGNSGGPWNAVRLAGSCASRWSASSTRPAPNRRLSRRCSVALARGSLVSGTVPTISPSRARGVGAAPAPGSSTWWS